MFQVTYLLHILSDARKIVSSLQYFGAIQDARDPDILNL